MITPTIHLNGTSPESLINDLTTAYDALFEAMDALRRTAPNGRDYYPQGPDALQKATAEHMGRMGAVQGVIKELDDLIQAVDGARGDR